MHISVPKQKLIGELMSS
uniref:Uncharacterized protein n=1 Tax=Rhizophora mucronata TaxID=61149 RepID=A0A2P2NYX9_RHIMU